MANHPNRSKRTQAPARNPTPAQILAAREAAGLTQREMGELLHTTTRSYQEWEYGTNRMHPAFWELLQRKLRELK